MKTMTIVGTHPEIIRLSRVIPCLDALTYVGNPDSGKEVADDPRYTFVQTDVADRPAVEAVFREYHPTLVVHFAAESHVDRSIWNEWGMSLLKERQL